MKKDGFNISDAPASFKRPETPPPPAPPAAEPDEDLICPVCEGSGEGWTMSDSGPDAHMIQVDCGECSGSGSLHGAYQTVKTQRDSLATRLSDAGGQMLFMRSEIESLKKELESHKRMLLAAACDIGAIGEALGADMDDDGSAIEGLAQDLRQKAKCVDDCAHLIRKLVHCRRQLATDDGLAEKALDYLKRKGLQGSPLRADEVAHD